MEEITQQNPVPAPQPQKKIIRMLLAGIILLLLALIGVTGYYTFLKNPVTSSTIQPTLPPMPEQSDQTMMEERRMMWREDSRSMLSYTPIANWHTANYIEDQVILISSPEYMKDEMHAENTYETAPKQGILITIKVHDRIDMHMNLQELQEWLKTQGKWDKMTVTQLRGIPAVQMYGKYKYPNVEDYSLPVQDDWYMSDEIQNEYFFDIRISYAGSPSEASALKTKYQSQLDQFLTSIKFETY